MDKKETIKILKAASKRIDVGWHQTSSRDYNWNIELRAQNPNRWNDRVPVCALGAVQWALTGDPIKGHIDTGQFLDILNKSIPSKYKDIVYFNDNPKTTHRKVKRVFRKAIRKVRYG